jgi:hypothetical protein
MVNSGFHRLIVDNRLQQEYDGDLVGALEHDFMTFRSVGNVIIPTDELIFFRGLGIPPTSHDIHVSVPKTQASQISILFRLDDVLWS